MDIIEAPKLRQLKKRDWDFSHHAKGVIYYPTVYQYAVEGTNWILDIYSYLGEGSKRFGSGFHQINKKNESGYRNSLASTGSHDTLNECKRAAIEYLKGLNCLFVTRFKGKKIVEVERHSRRAFAISHNCYEGTTTNFEKLGVSYFRMDYWSPDNFAITSDKTYVNSVLDAGGVLKINVTSDTWDKAFISVNPITKPVATA